MCPTNISKHFSRKNKTKQISLAKCIQYLLSLNVISGSLSVTLTFTSFIIFSDSLTLDHLRNKKLSSCFFFLNKKKLLLFLDFLFYRQIIKPKRTIQCNLRRYGYNFRRNGWILKTEILPFSNKKKYHHLFFL